MTKDVPKEKNRYKKLLKGNVGIMNYEFSRLSFPLDSQLPTINDYVKD